MRCVVLDDYQDVALAMADWSRLAERVEVTVLREHLDSEDALVEALSGVEVLVVMRERTPLTGSLLARLPGLRLVVTSGMRNASIDLAAAERQGVVVCGSASRSEPAVELTWALILGLARKLVPESTALRAGGPWQSSVGVDLAGSTLGLLGLGKIGTRVAAVGAAFGMDVLAWSQNLTEDRAAAAGARLAASKEELLAASDFVSIHLVLGERTRGLVDAESFVHMRQSAYLVNTSRAAIVDQAALVDALRAGRIAGAGLDVFEVEPLPADHPLRSLPTVLATPHLGYVTKNNYSAYFREAVEDIEAFLAGAPIRVLGAAK
ncbi:D-2-hydroxyacid dehydrogenase family protein [Kutzneria albida]|uniref:D-2-hydroxyacid dehydrogenase family protein n=1 Tax=Kutzneria albida TaxID=43357 RepID=UPI00191C15C2|nr:D-2-hydroxyacid dehydrogenase family protein [Kutzneria albida]